MFAGLKLTSLNIIKLMDNVINVANHVLVITEDVLLVIIHIEMFIILFVYVLRDHKKQMENVLVSVLIFRMEQVENVCV